MARCLFINSLISRVILQVFVCSLFIKEILPYEKILLENNKLCPLIDGKEGNTVKLGKDESSSKIVTQSRYFERWSGKYAFSCSFLVKAPSNYGLYAVIQFLDFRKNETTGSCIDYVEFEIPQRPFQLLFFKKKEKLYKKFCGKISPSESYISDEEYGDILKYSTVGNNGFLAVDGWIHVSIHLAKEKLKPDEKLDINIAFTSYKQDCNKREKSIQCSECEWIWDGLHLDKIQNCPYISCLDENFCKEIDTSNVIRNVVSSETGTKVSIGAVATIILVLLMFGSCVWMSRRLQLWCFNPSTNNQSRMEMNSTQRNSRLNDNVTPYGDMLPDSATPSAPPISDDKDLPPSYSSLFPEK